MAIPLRQWSICAPRWPTRPGSEDIEIDLAEALAGAGRTQEATSYFTTLWEAEPGSGIINLQLARLAARQGNESEALERYRASIYGNWEGDGTVRRRSVRLELIDYLIDRHRYSQAQGELIIAAGNAPDDPAIKLQIAALMEKAGDAERREPDLQDNPAARSRTTCRRSRARREPHLPWATSSRRAITWISPWPIRPRPANRRRPARTFMTCAIAPSTFCCCILRRRSALSPRHSGSCATAIWSLNGCVAVESCSPAQRANSWAAGPAGAASVR